MISTVLIEDQRTPAGRPVRAIHLSRAGRRNSLSPPELEGLIRALEGASHRAILFSAQPPAFCAGLDLKHLAAAPDLAGAIAQSATLLARLYERLAAHAAPTLALVDGPAVGGGLGLAASFDRVLATRRSAFILPGGPLEPLAQLVLPILGRRGFHPSGPVNLAAYEAGARGLADEILLQPMKPAEALAAIDRWIDCESTARRIVARRIPLPAGAMRQRIEAATSPATLPQLEKTLRNHFP